MMNGYAMSSWGWLLMTLGMLGFWALVAVDVFQGVVGHHGQPTRQHRGQAAGRHRVYEKVW
jgi:hypothetical protein